MADLLNVMRVYSSNVDKEGNKTRKESGIYILTGDMRMSKVWDIKDESDGEVEKLMQSFQKTFDLGRNYESTS